MKRPYTLLRSAMAVFVLLLVASSSAQSYYTIGSGTGSNGTFEYPTPYNGYYWGMHAQYLYLASELSAAGMTSGPISAIRFNVTALNQVNNVPGAGGGINGFTIGIKQTATASLPTTSNPGDWQTGFTNIVGPTLYTVTAGFNVHTLSTPFMWDGVSNILIDICSQNGAWTSDGNASVQFTTGLTFNGSRTFRQDAAGTCASNSTTGNVPSARPNIGFEWMPSTSCSGTPIGGTATAPASVCPSIGFVVSVTGGTSAIGLTYQWESSTDGTSYNPVSPGGTGPTLAISSISGTTWYRRIATCTASGQSGTSTPAQVNLTSFVSCYCIPPAPAFGCDIDHIGTVAFTSASNPINNINNTCSANGYGDYTGIIPAAVVTQANVVPLKVTVYNGGTEYAGAWIDYNQNGSFDASEFITLTAPVLVGSYWEFNTTVTIPVTAAPGTTRLRVRGHYSSAVLPTDACAPYSSSYGETEDYLVTINAQFACSGAPAPGNTTGPSAACSSTAFTLGLSNAALGSGIAYLWQSSPDGIAWGPAPGANTGANYSTTQATTTHYRCQTTCTNPGGSTTTSTPLVVGMQPACVCGSYCITSNFGDGACITGVTLNSLSSTTAACVASPGYTLKGETTVLLKGTTYALTVNVNNLVYGGGIVSVWFDWNNDATFSPTEWWQVYTAGVTGTVNITVPSTAYEGTIRMRVRSRGQGNANGSGDACLTMGSGTTEDFCVTIAPLLPCTNPPSAGTLTASATAVCPSTVVSLTTTGTTYGIGMSYQWESSPDNVAWTDIPLATNPSYAPLMTTPTWFRMRAVCSAGAPEWTNSVQVTINSFISCYCPSSATNVNDTEIGNVTVGTMNNTSLCGVTAPGPGSSMQLYSNFTTSVAPPVLNQATSIPYSVTVTQCNGFNYSSRVAIFIDYNQNGIFSDPGEKVAGETIYQSTLATNTPINSYTVSGNFDVPVPLPSGNTRMRVIVFETTGAISPCGTYPYGETEDYLVTIGPAPTCLPPTNVQAFPTGPDAGQVNFTCTSCSGDFYVEYGTPGFVPGTQGTAGSGTLLGPFQSTDFPINILGLASNTTYGVRVRRDCGAGDWSPNTGQVTFTTALTCGDTYTDLGGVGGVYPNFSNQLTTICPNIPNAAVIVTFSLFDTEMNYDPMYVFNGPSTSAPMIASANGVPSDIPNLPVNYGAGGWWGTTAPNNIAPNTLMATNPSGCLTFHFVSDDVVQYPGWVANVGCFTLNSTCADAQTVTCNSATFGFTGIGTTNLPPDACPFNGPASTGGTNWFKYIAGNTGEVTASVCGTATWDTRISVFRAQPDCSSLQCWALNDNTPGCANGSSEVNFPTTSGETYYIVVHGAGSSNGTYSLVVLCNASCGNPVPNETCNGAVVVAPTLLGTGGLTTYDNTCAYSDGTPSCSGSSPAQGMWYSFNAGTKTELELSLHTNFENSMYTATSISYAVYSGGCTSASASNEVSCATNGQGTNTISGLTPFTDYHLLVYNSGGIGVQGTFGLNLEFRPDHDASVITVDSPIGLTCGNAIVPVVTIKNNGLVPLTSVRIYYNVDAGPDQNFVWIGLLAPGATTQVTLPVINASAGTHILLARTDQPNNMADEIPSNDAASSNFNNNGQPIRVLIRTDNFGDQIGWDIIDGFGFPVASGGLSSFPTVPYGNNTSYTSDFCLSTTFGNCYSLFLYDINGDGMCCANGSGSWELSTWGGQILLRDLFASTPDGWASPTWAPASPGYVNGHEFCLPKGPSDIEPARCNIFTYNMLSKVFCTPVGGATNYQFEFTDPDAGFRRRISVPRNWVQFSEMQTTNPLIPGVVYFARVRVDQGAPGYTDDNFGAGCDLGLTGVPNCTSLINQLTLPTHSCNVVKTFGFSDKIWTYPVIGATNYRFRFTNAGEGYQRVVGRTNYVCPLNWLNQPLVNGSTYQVDVEVRVSGVWSGYCGGVCAVTIANGPSQGGRTADVESNTDQVQLWPNPVRDGQVNLRIDGIIDQEQRISVDVFDLYGKRVLAKQYENSGELFNTVLDLGHNIAAGMYQVTITVNDRVHTERVSVQ